jgi:hypothetical protein
MIQKCQWLDERKCHEQMTQPIVCSDESIPILLGSTFHLGSPMAENMDYGDKIHSP